MKRIIGLDLGSVTCGVAVSDLMGMIASPVETVRFENEDYDTCLEKLQPIFKKYNVTDIVLGLPKHMNGDIGIRGEISIQFKEMLESQGLEVILWDERLTTVAAHKTMNFLDINKNKKKNIVDTISAVYILETYLNKTKNSLQN